MRFHPDGPSIPDALLERCDAGRVVFLCGAGVSFPSGMPTFLGLTEHVIEFYDPPADSEIMAAFRPWLDPTRPTATNVPLDQIFNLLHLEYGKNEVNALVTERLRAPREGDHVGREHSLIKRISCSESGVPQIVTTNFDRLFEQENGGDSLILHVPPAFPDLNFGSKIEGVTYLHGRLVDEASENHSYVLSSADFGRAYLSEGWATNFIRHLLERYTVVMVGYQAEDPPIKYLLQGLNHDGQYDRSRLYAFDRGLPEEIEAKWRDRGVTAIAYSDHPVLWQSMTAWADRADDPRGWRSSIIAKSQHDPKSYLSHERGQVAHVLRTAQGARLLVEMDPPAHPEWVCVMDANVRSAKPSRGYGDGAEVFDPREAYGLDDDLSDISEAESKQGVSNDNLLIWRNADDNPPAFHRLAGIQIEWLEAPKRLGHLINWLSASVGSPVLAWWSIRQNGLHPRLLQQFEWRVKTSTTLDKRARHIWNLILESNRDPRNGRWNGDWFDLKRRLDAEGWTAGTMREFRRVVAPQLRVTLPNGLAQSKPPAISWEETRLHDLGRWEVVFLSRHDQDVEIGDDVLPQVFGILEEQLTIASGLLNDIETSYFRIPTCYPGRQVDGNTHASSASEVVAWFLQLFDRLATNSPRVAKGYAATWRAADQYFFRKLKLYAFSKVNVFEAGAVAYELLSFDQEAFWDTAVARELLFLLVDRWTEFSEHDRDRLIDRILAGPDQLSHWSDDEFHELRDELAVRYARYLQLNGCALSADRSERLASMVAGVQGWTDAWATSMVVERGSRIGWIATDERPDAIINLPVNEVISKAKEDLKRDFHNFTEKRSFTGLVKVNPRKALSALTIAGKAGDYPTEFWASMVSDFPADVAPRIKRVFLNRLVRLPHPVVAELRHTLGHWLTQRFGEILRFDEDLGWAVYDHIIDGILSAGAGGARSGLGEMRQGDKVIQRSRRTYGHAINGPVGMCTQALFDAVPGKQQEPCSLIPDHIKSRVERLFSAPGEGSDHAVSVVCSKLNWLMSVDPSWTEHRVIPMLGFDHSAAEAAWNGFLYCNQNPSSALVKIIKPLLINLYPWIEGFSWERDVSSLPAQWLGYMRVFHADEPHGLSRGEMRSALRAMSDHTRNQFVFWLGQVGQLNENGWAEHVIPLINEDWPRERRYGTSALMLAWIRLLDNTGDSFPAVYEAVKKFLVPLETADHPFHRYTKELGGDTSITGQFPDQVLDLMNRATPHTLTRPPYQLPMVLALIAEAQPSLMADQRYLRLIDLVERS